MSKQLGLLAALLLALAIRRADSQGAPTAAAATSAPLGAYLGCFDLQHVKNLPGLRETGDAPHTASTLYQCPAACRAGNFSITFISTALHCWCALATPEVNATLPISACKAGGPGVAAFYQHDLAATHWCKVVPTHLTPEDISVDYGQYYVEFTPVTAAAANTAELPAQMRIRMEGSSGARVQPKAPPQLYGQFEVTAKVTEAVGAVTAFYVRDSDEYNQDNSGDFEEIDVEFLNGHPGIPNSVWFNSYHRGLSRGEQLTKPEVYQRLLNLSSSANNTNTWLTYTFTWQPSHVMWAINGVPLLRRTTGELVRWSDMKGKPFERIFASPDRPMHVSFSMWNDNSRFHFGGELDYSKSPYYSFFRELRRIACVDPLPANATEPYGPAWLYEGKASWPAAPVPAYTVPPLPSPSPSPSPVPSSPSPSPPRSCASSSPAVSPASATNMSKKDSTPSPTPTVAAPAKASPQPLASAPEQSPANSSASPAAPAPAPLAVVPAPAPAPALAPAPASPVAATSPDRQPVTPGQHAAPAPADSPAPVPIITAPAQPSNAAGPKTAPKPPSLTPQPALAASAAPVQPPLEPQQDKQQQQQAVAMVVPASSPALVSPSTHSSTDDAVASLQSAGAPVTTQVGKLDTAPQATAASAQQPPPQPQQARPQLLRAAAVEAASLAAQQPAVRRNRRWLRQVQDNWQQAAGDTPLAEALGAAW